MHMDQRLRRRRCAREGVVLRRDVAEARADGEDQVRLDQHLQHGLRQAVAEMPGVVRVVVVERMLLLEGQCDRKVPGLAAGAERSEEHTSELQSLMRISYAVFCLKKKKQQ